MDVKVKDILSHATWRHSVELGQGLKTPGQVRDVEWDFMNLPKDLTGKSVLDVGASDGLVSFEAEKRGATEVVCSDIYKDTDDDDRKGWSNQGILFLKDYFRSNVKLHNRGIYHLTDLNKKFDVVLVLNLINWLEDIELAFQNLGEATKGELYLVDGFITDNKRARRVRAETQEEGLAYMYNLKFITKIMEKNGFRIETVKKLNYQKFFIHDFLTVQQIVIPKGTKIYTLPDATSDFVVSERTEASSNYDLKGFYHISSQGWVLKSEVQAHYNKPSMFFRLAKKLSLLGLYYNLLKIRHERQSKTIAYMIKAIKVK
jgi:2-polyprenyl-3-methyl-5-hydroxy-6-metoxy-1,4-benzoquinol methylase